MRLICPNCGAQYEVPDNVIPENGRDVQCSNCGDTWFQKHPSQDRELAEELDQSLDEVHWDADSEADTPDETGGGWEDTRNEALPSADADAPEAEAPDIEPPFDDHPTSDEDDLGDAPGPDDEAALASAQEADIGSWPETDPDADLDDTTLSETDTWLDESPEDEPETASHPEDAAPKPRGLDPEVRDVLREEADFELRARSAHAGTLEEQPDLGLDTTEDEASRREREARQRMARMRGISEEEAAAASAAAGAGLAAQTSRRDLLPDIDEINSTLRRSSARGEAPEIDHSTTSSAPAKQRGGFRRGFMTLILIAVIALLLYIYAPKIAEMVPALGGVLEAYVSAINSARAWLDGQILSLLGWLDGMSSGGDAAPPASGS
ncbi:zinc-ribbon domain-containing protein [Rhodalgimonas zhirmunskyi]|uniref:Zinc-ribbon domain-containing protein n=1 Tax=Rhodalgimonas zhirmunskyi TaxID=2964767 RepID=A0AAJ1UES6_9RHOB|nr:zinc-ribbon domain-containing protein [Rhodoalgimonas zhirmunskyi]MDQ2094722.1 zinc-ribbon domain-containing protein [Rhodoalgimonas zhirmunskyi]